jgi:hypothetical protein
VCRERKEKLDQDYRVKTEKAKTDEVNAAQALIDASLAAEKEIEDKLKEY